MTATSRNLTFDENGVFEANVAAFFAHVAQEDAALGAELQSQFKALSEGPFNQSDFLNGLFAAAEKPSPVKNASATAAAATSQSATPVRTTVTATGWLLEGLSIEGFRGINNQGKPLELKFHLDKVNSISAVNGVGKSSVYDAVRYAICGAVPWLDDLPASERGSDYYLNKFNTSGTATITLKLVAEPGGQQVAITVRRDAQGNRTMSSTPATDAEAILRSLNREFVLLDGHSFQSFISAKPLDRGRTFSGLLGLAQYSAMRQSLAAIANTRAFNNHFAVAEHAQLRGREEKGAADARAAIAADYAVLVGQPLAAQSGADAQVTCHHALEQIGPLKPLCENMIFHDIDVNACIEAVKAAEGGPKRDRLSECIRERADLKRLNVEAPKSERAAALADLAKARDQALTETAGDVMLTLFQAGQKALALPAWSDPTLCPLCDQKGSHDLKAHIASKLSQFDALEQAGTAIAKEWGEAGWSDLAGLESKLEEGADNRLIAKLRSRAEKGELASKDAESLAEWLKTLRSRADQREQSLAVEQATLERELPPSAVEVTRKVEAARRLQVNWRKLAEAERAAGLEQARETLVTRMKRFLDAASDCFGAAEGALSKARLIAVEPVFRAYFDKLSFFGVVPTVTKRANSEDLQIALADFHGLPNLSPQALLSESFRNAFAISLYLAAASLYGGLPKFIVLDDVTSSFDAGHQNFLVELLRTTFARPANAAGLQVILLSHDTMLEKLFNKHSNTGTWWHQRLEGVPQLAVLPQAGAVNKVRDQTISMLQAGQVDFAKEGVRQYLEYRLSDLISRLRIPVPFDVAFNDNKQLAYEFLQAIEAAVTYLRQLPATLAGINLQYGLTSHRAELVKTLEVDDGRVELRAVTGPDYGRIYDHELVAAVQRIAGNGTGDTRWKVPGVLDWSTGIYNPRVDVTKDTTTLYASDRDVFLFLVDDLNPIEAGRLSDGSPDLYFRGFYCWNSEVGAKTLGIASFYLRAVCQNRNLWGVEDFEEITIRHSKFAASRFAREAAPGLTRFADSSPMPFVNGIRAARQRIVARTDDERTEFLRKRGFSKSDTAKIVETVLAEEGRKPESIFDFVQGITAVARDKPHQDARLDLETRAKKLLDRVA